MKLVVFEKYFKLLFEEKMYESNSAVDGNLFMDFQGSDCVETLYFCEF